MGKTVIAQSFATTFLSEDVLNNFEDFDPYLSAYSFLPE